MGCRLIASSPLTTMSHKLKLRMRKKWVFVKFLLCKQGHFESWSVFYGCRRCDWLNVVLVNKKTGVKKPLFETEKKISAFFVPKELETKSKLPNLVYLILSAGKDLSISEFYIANFDGSNLKRVSPEGQTVVTYDFDIPNKKLFLLLRETGPESEQNDSRPYIVDLSKSFVAAPMLEK